MSDNSRGATLVRAIEACIHPAEGVIADLGSIFTDDVTVWSPTMLVIGLGDLAETLAIREPAFADVEITFTSLGVLGNKGFVEFHVDAKFVGPFVIDDPVAIEPNGRRIVLGAAAVADFEGDKIKALRGYFDDATLLEQMLDAKV